MEEELGLRERKKRATWSLLMSTALDMFEARGYDNVSVAEIAEEAGVSKATVFNYFPSKEELVVGGAKSHTDEPAELVRDRPAGQTPHSVMREYFLRSLERHEPMSGLCDDPIVLQVHRIIRMNPGLSLRLMDYRRRAAARLAEQLIAEGGSELTSNLVASQLMHVQHILSLGNIRLIYADKSIEEIYPGAVAAAEHAFRLLEHGIGDFMRREAGPFGAADVTFNGGDPVLDQPEHHAGYTSAQADRHREVERILSGVKGEVYERLTDPDRP